MLEQPADPLHYEMKIPPEPSREKDHSGQPNSPEEKLEPGKPDDSATRARDDKP